MKHRYLGRLSLAVVVTGIATGAAGQENVPDLRGRWLSAGEAVVIGEDPHVPGQSGVSYTMIKSAESDGGVFIIEEQNGLRFAGRFESPARTEQLIGAIAPDLENGIMVDDDGVYQLEIHDANTLEVCYAHITLDSRLAGCGELTRIVE